MSAQAVKKRSANWHTIEWYEETQRNSEEHIAQEEMNLARLSQSLARLKSDIATRAERIARAKREGLTGFDATRYGVKP